MSKKAQLSSYLRRLALSSAVLTAASIVAVVFGIRHVCLSLVENLLDDNISTATAEVAESLDTLRLSFRQKAERLIEQNDIASALDVIDVGALDVVGDRLRRHDADFVLFQDYEGDLIKSSDFARLVKDAASLGNFLHDRSQATDGSSFAIVSGRLAIISRVAVGKSSDRSGYAILGRWVTEEDLDKLSAAEGVSIIISYAGGDGLTASSLSEVVKSNLDELKSSGRAAIDKNRDRLLAKTQDLKTAVDGQNLAVMVIKRYSGTEILKSDVLWALALLAGLYFGLNLCLSTWASRQFDRKMAELTIFLRGAMTGESPSTLQLGFADLDHLLPHLANESKNQIATIKQMKHQAAESDARTQALIEHLAIAACALPTLDDAFACLAVYAQSSAYNQASWSDEQKDAWFRDALAAVLTLHFRALLFDAKPILRITNSLTPPLLSWFAAGTSGARELELLIASEFSKASEAYNAFLTEHRSLAPSHKISSLFAAQAPRTPAPGRPAAGDEGPALNISRSSTAATIADQYAASTFDLRDYIEILDALTARLGRKAGKQVNPIIVEGTCYVFDTRLRILLLSTLAALLENAVVHSIEKPTLRLQSAKPESGYIKITALRVGDMIDLQVSDDGLGTQTWDSVEMDGGVRKIKGLGEAKLGSEQASLHAVQSALFAVGGQLLWDRKQRLGALFVVQCPLIIPQDAQCA